MAVKVLAIDGGGIRGLIPALVLAEIEDRTGESISDLFDLIAGTSTGGLIALGLSAPGHAGRPRWSARKIVELYEERGHEIFQRSLYQRIRSANGVLDERYSAAGLEAVLDEYVGDVRLADARNDLLIPAYETKDRFPFFFRSARARARPDYDFPMPVVGRATSAAPTYFEAMRVEDANGREYSLIDGGMFANNPAMCAYVDVVDSDPDADVVLLSLGTGGLTKPHPWREVKDWGLIEWGRPVLEVMFDGVSATTHYHLEMLLDDESYWRFQIELTKGRGSDDLDNSEEANIAALRNTALEMIRERSADLDAACAALMAT